MEVPGGGQIVIQGRYAFVGHQHGPDGTTILDISDPRHPKIVHKIMLENPMTHSHKVRVVGDIMITNVEQNHRHATRAAARLVETEATLTAELGRPPKDAELAYLTATVVNDCYY